MRETGKRFRNVGWTCFGILLATGCFNLWVRGVRLADFHRSEWLGSHFGKTMLLKLAVFSVVLTLSLVHDFVLGPRATVAIARAANSAEAQRLRRLASLAGRANVILALVLLALGVMLVRGTPW